MSELEGKTLGNYRIARRLGTGGMGTVWLATTIKSKKGLKAGSEVALKVLHPHLAADEGILRRFRREAGLGLSLAHRNVVATHDIGSEKIDGTVAHFIAMERLTGRTLKAVLDQDGPLPESRVFAIAKQAASALAAIHEQGIIHRDIKPANLFLDDHDRLHVADLGLSRLLEPSTEISLPGTFLGSASYAAPEQVESQDVGPEADLYALGVTLYELVTGFNPFLGTDLRSTMANQMRTIARPISASAPETSYFLEKVVAALLEKDPKRRLGPAARLLRILEEREQSEWWRGVIEGESESTQLTQARRKLRVRRATRVYGRDESRAKLEDALRTAIVGRSGRVAVITGESGIGKSRLIDSALESPELESLESRVLVSRFLDQSAATPYYALNEVLLTAFDLLPAEREIRRARLPELLRENLPERRVFADAFAMLIDGTAPATKGHALPGEAVPALYAEALRTLSVRKPILLVIEEIQWADRGSLRALATLAQAISMFPIALVLTARKSALVEESPGEPPAAQFFKSLCEQRDAVHLALERLEEAAVRSIVRDYGVPAAIQKTLALRLFEASEGNPGFLDALIEDLDRRGKLRSMKAAELKKLPLPKTIVDLLGRKLEDVDAEARRFLEFASVFGVRFKPEPVIEGLGLEFVKATQVLSRLTQRYGVVREFDDAYRFDHHQLRERVYLGIDPHRRGEYHLKVGQILARSITDPSAPTRANYEAGIHFSFAEAHAAAVRHLIGAVAFCVERSLFERAERLARKALTHLSQVSEQSNDLSAATRFELMVIAAEVEGHLGRRAQQGEHLRAAARIAYAGVDAKRIAEVETQLATHAAATGLVFAAMQHCERARDASRRAGDLALEAHSIRVEAHVLSTLGQNDFEAQLARADALASQAGDELGRAYGWLLLGQLYLATDRLELALDIQKQALGNFERLEDPRGRGRAFFQLARVYRELGDLERAEKAVEVALGIAEANSDQNLVARAMYLSGDIAMRRGDLARARPLLESAIERFKTAVDAAFEVYAHVSLALLLTSTHFPLRDPHLAATYASNAVSIAQRCQLERQEAYAFAALAVAYLAQDKPKFALAVSRKGVKFAEEHEAGRKREAELSFIHYRCLKALRRRDEAEGYLQRARELVLERSRAIEDPLRRATFLENDRFNAVVLAEAEKVLGADVRS